MTKRLLQDWIISIRTLGGLGESVGIFDILVDNEEEKKEIGDHFQRLAKKASQKPQGASNPHIMHKFRTFSMANEDPDPENPSPPPVCDLCNMILIGMFFTGYECFDCKKFYHERCFIEGIPDLAFTEELGKSYCSTSLYS